MRSTLALVFALFACTASASDRSAAEQAVLAQFEALRAEGMVALVEFTHPDEVERLGRMLRPMLDPALGEASMEEAVALLGVDSIEQARRLDSPQLIRALFGTLDARMRGEMQFQRFDLIGSVPEGEVVHVLGRLHMEMAGLRMHKLEVISMKRHRGEWLGMLSGEIEGIAEAIGKRFPAPVEVIEFVPKDH